MFYDREVVNSVKSAYPPGTRVQVDFMGNDPHPISSGTKGSVLFVDDIGTVHCRFDNGRVLGLIPGEDCFHKITPQNRNRDDAR